MEPLLILNSIKKRVRKKMILNGVDLVLKEGSLIFIGGDLDEISLLLEIIAGMKKPDSGSILRLQKEIFYITYKKDFLIENLTVLENLILPLPGAYRKYKETVDFFLKKLELFDIKDRKVLFISFAQRKQLEFLRAFLFAKVILIENCLSVKLHLMEDYIRKLKRGVIFGGQNKNDLATEVNFDKIYTLKEGEINEVRGVQGFSN